MAATLSGLGLTLHHHIIFIILRNDAVGDAKPAVILRLGK
jgi:hypothetical protein